MPKKSKSKINKMKKLMKKRKTEKKRKEKYKTTGSWFNILICLGIFIFILAWGVDMTLFYLDKAFDATIYSYVGLGILLFYTISFLFILAGGFIFNIISKMSGEKFSKSYKKHPLLLKIDKAIDSFLWWLIPIYCLGWLLVHVIIVECFYETCI